MSESKLTFASTSSFRNTLIAKNLVPYKKDGVYTPKADPQLYETTLSDSSVIDSPDSYIDQDPFGKQLYVLNQFGPEGGYNLQINYNGAPLPVNSNQGEYNPNDTNMDLLNEFFIDAAYIENRYGPQGGFNDMVIVTDTQSNNKIYQPYWNPPSFAPSTYSPYSILLSDNPSGSNGSLSQDSYIAKLGATTLKKEFQERIGREIKQRTIGALSLESLQDPFNASLLATGQQPLVTLNYQITVPENPVLAAADLATRLAGAYFPVSPIPGDYFNENTTANLQTNQTSTALSSVNQLTGGLLGPILNLTRNPSQIFLANTGNGQRSVLYSNLSYNRYQPGYDKNYGGILGVAQGAANVIGSLIGLTSTIESGYYVGSRNAEPSQITSPPNQIPVNSYGQQDPSPVYGPSELGILYEGNQEQLNFALAANPSINGGGINGQFVWTSPKYKGNAGFRATPGGGAGSLDKEFNLISNDYTKGESTNVIFRKNSILDKTQKLIESADGVQGTARLKHVGNAINQVSKVFNDGYKELTKGSKVVSYKENATGNEVGIEYCRVFAKDTPYYTFADLQKTDGITKSGRRFTNSVLDNTYNLNIAPIAQPGSTNILKGADGKFYAKKYMFSIENLAWRTSSRPGFTYNDLPDAEKGPNGGRVMWFPPYDLTFNDTSKATWTPTSFLGRPEPIYTYKDTNRTGTISWKIVVDQPSILDIIVNKQLNGVQKEKVDSILESFFAGCVKYDLYTLAKKFNKIPTSQLEILQDVINRGTLTRQDVQEVVNQTSKENTGGDKTKGSNDNVNLQLDSNAESLNSFIDYAFYFDYNSPSSPQNYSSLYNSYIDENNIKTYVNNVNNRFSPNNVNSNVREFFNTIIKTNWDSISEGPDSLIEKMFSVLSAEKGTISLILQNSSSASGSDSYNNNIKKNREDSIIEYFKSTKLKTFIEDKKTLKISSSSQNETEVIPKGSLGNGGGSFNCKETIKDKNGVVIDKFPVSDMACRRVKIKQIIVTPTTSQEVKDSKSAGQSGTIQSEFDNPTKEVSKLTNSKQSKPQNQPTKNFEDSLKQGLSKKILRSLLNESDYFQLIQDEAPMVFDSLKEKLKYFHPSFHSTTPEGLNSRLTFLNQCVRPGQTIPVIGTDGKTKSNDAQNTSFGAPPILILRIGDFYHTKIVPDTLSITYDPLLFDMNPEGIGLQPMIAKVSLNFSFIGGHGLAKPVEQLQNALSFNFYGNTEIYDERAVATEDTSALDKQIFDSLVEKEQPISVNNLATQQQNNGGNTIGTIATTIPITDGQTGTTTFQSIMDSLLVETSKYCETIVNQFEKIVNITNYGILQLVVSERKYSEGEIGAQQGEIVGKPENQEEQINNVFKKCIEDVNLDNNPLINYLKVNNPDIDSLSYDLIKKNLKEYINNLQNSFSNEIVVPIQELSNFQQNFVQIIRKLNFVKTMSDGKIGSGGTTLIYNLSPTQDVSPLTKDTNITDTEQEFIIDFETLKTTLETFKQLLVEEKIFGLDSGGNPQYDKNDCTFFALNTNSFPNSTSPEYVYTQRFFLIISRIFADKNKKNDFINKIIKGPLNDVKKLKSKFETAVNKYAVDFSNELSDEEKLYKKFKKTKNYDDYVEGIEDKMYPKGKVRKFEYTTIPNPQTETTQKESLIFLYQTVNPKPNETTFTNQVKFN